MQDLPKIVLHRLQQATGAEAHPDPDLLTAFVEHSLADSERARMLEHLARCGNCREIVTLALPATEAVTLPLSASAPRNRWFNWPVLRWGVVAAGILAVASIGMVQYKQRQLQLQLKNERPAPILTARNDAIAVAQGLQPSPGALEGQPVVPHAEGRQVESRKKALPNIQKKLLVSKSVGSMSSVPKPYAPRTGGWGGAVGGAAASGFAPAQKRMPVASAARTSVPRPGPQFAVPPSSQMVEVQTAEAATVATAQSQIPDQLIQNQKELPLQNRSITDSDVVKAKAPALPQAAPSAASAQTPEPSSIPSLEAPSVMLRASPTWTISSSGVLQRSFDAGNTWQDVNVNSISQSGPLQANLVGVEEKKVQKQAAQPLVFRAVTAIGSEVWAGGSGAALYHSADSGDHWMRVLPSSASRVLTGDITVIEFANPQHGRITTSAGQIWITADAGQSWRLQP